MNQDHIMDQDPLKIDANFYKDASNEAIGPEDNGNPKKNLPPDRILWSWTLSAIDMWIGKAGGKVGYLIQKYIGFNDLWEDGAMQLNKIGIAGADIAKPQNENMLELSSRVLKAMNSLKSHKDCPTFGVKTEFLHNVPSVTAFGDDV